MNVLALPRAISAMLVFVPLSALLRMLHAPCVNHLEAISAAYRKAETVNAVTRFYLVQQAGIVFGKLRCVIKIFTNIPEEMRVLICNGI